MQISWNTLDTIFFILGVLHFYKQLEFHILIKVLEVEWGVRLHSFFEVAALPNVVNIFKYI